MHAQLKLILRLVPYIVIVGLICLVYVNLPTHDFTDATDTRNVDVEHEKEVIDRSLEDNVKKTLTTVCEKTVIDDEVLDRILDEEYDKGTFTTACEQGINCHLPNCLCPYIKNYPLNFSRDEVPQMVIFASDDSVNQESYDFYTKIFADHKNLNGCPFTGTVFVSDTDGLRFKKHSHLYDTPGGKHELNYKLVRKLYDKGWDIGLHGYNHINAESVDEMVEDAAKMFKEVHRRTEIPISEIKGWRSPYLLSLFGDEVKTLRRLGLVYSMTFGTQYYSWPFTLDFPFMPKSVNKHNPAKRLDSEPGFWIIPRHYYDALPFSDTPVSYIDDVAANWDDQTLFNTEKEIERIINAEFESHYNGDRSPFIINTHGSLYRRNPHALTVMVKFFKRLANTKDVFVVSAAKALEWTRAPVELSKINQFKSWGC